jgi:hypothetical protein
MTSAYRTMLTEVSYCRPPVRSQPRANLCELYWSLAVSYARLNDRAGALAVHAGWVDGAWLENDPELAALRAEPRFCALHERIAQATFDRAELNAAAAL